MLPNDLTFITKLHSYNLQQSFCKAKKFQDQPVTGHVLNLIIILKVYALLYARPLFR